ncbi:hypothetical protein D049_2559B, partial [Vibrio parahaemolyticus VPTS-2010]
LAGRG